MRKIIDFFKKSPESISRAIGLPDEWVLRTHQITALRYSLLRFAEDRKKGFILADEMGLGKTITVLSVLKLLDYFELTSGHPHLIIVPVSVIPHWEKEAKLVFDDYDIYTYHGTSRDKKIREYTTLMNKTWITRTYKKMTKQRNAAVNDVLNTLRGMWKSTTSFGKKRFKFGTFPQNVVKLLFKNIAMLKDHWMPKIPKKPGYTGPKCIITTPGVIRSSGGGRILRKVTRKFGGVILDEAHIIRNASLIGKDAKEENHTQKASDTKALGSKISREVYALVPRSTFRIALTGTPLVNKEEDIISLAKFISHGPSASPMHFFSVGDRPRRLANFAEDFVLRRRKIDVAKLPDKFVHTHYLFGSKKEVDYNREWSTELEELMNQFEEDGQDKASKAEISQKILGILTRMRQLCISRSLYTQKDSTETLPKKPQTLSEKNVQKWLETPDEDSKTHPVTDLFNAVTTHVKFDWSSITPKLLNLYEESVKIRTALSDVLRLTNGGPVLPRFHKGYTVEETPPVSYDGARVVVVCSQFVRALELFAILLQCPAIQEKFKAIVKTIPKVLIYHGGMTHSAREQVLNVARSSKEPTVLLLSFMCGNVGLNLMFPEENERLSSDRVSQSQSKSQHLYQLDTWWNKAMMNQLFDRVHRLTQTREVHIHQLINRGTIEEYMLHLQHSKHAKAMELFGKEDERVFAGLQRDMYANQSAKKFTLKGAVTHLLKVRDEYAKNSELSRITEKMRDGFRDPKILTSQPDKHKTAVNSQKRSVPVNSPSTSERTCIDLTSHTHDTNPPKKRKSQDTITFPKKEDRSNKRKLEENDIYSGLDKLRKVFTSIKSMFPN